MYLITTIFSLMVATLSSGTQSWASNALHSKRAELVKNCSVLSVRANNKQGTPSKQRIAPAASKDVMFTLNGVTAFDPDIEYKQQRIDEALARAETSYNLGEYEQAYSSLIASEDKYPIVAGSIEYTKIQYAFLANHYEQAYDMVIRINRQQANKPAGRSISPRYLLMLSLASALNGEVYAGEADYCRDQVADVLKHHALLNVEMDLKLAKRNDAKAIAVMSCLGLGLRPGGQPFLELALKLDPTNSIAANELICYYGLRERKADIVRIAKSVLKALPADNENRAKFEKDLADNQ